MALALVAISAPAPGQDRLQALIAAACLECHDTQTAKGDLRLDALRPLAQDLGGLATWMRVQERVLDGEMPPKKPLAAGDASAFTAELGRQLLAAEALRRRTEGRVPLRRLNRVEYQHTLEDLLGIEELAVKDVLPPDTVAAGFDDIAAAQELSYVHLARYVEAADAALAAAMVLRPQPQAKVERILMRELGEVRNQVAKTGEIDAVGDWAVWVRQRNNAQGQWFIRDAPPEPGRYRFRVRCRGAQLEFAGNDHAADSRLLPPTVHHVLALQASNTRYLQFFDVPAEAGTVEFTAYVRGREQLSWFFATLDDRAPPPGPYKGPGVAVEWLEIEGPLDASWPPPSQRRLFGDLPLARWDRNGGVREPEQAMIGTGATQRADRPPGGPYVVVSKDPPADCARLLRAFMERAWRRPVEAAEVARIQGTALAALAEHRCFQDAMRSAYQAVLCSPDFLFLREAPGRLDAYSVASRLSYFLWRSLPDEALLRQAATGALLRPEVLRSETERLLNDARAQRFVADFTDQWLKLADIYATVPDRSLYPEYFCDNHVVESMLGEVRAYFAEMLSGDLGARCAVASDFAMVNERLAQLYGIPGVSGCALRRVALPKDSPRGGFLTMAGVMKVTANGTTTSPVKRGAWVLDRLLGRPPRPPPANVAALEPDTRGATTIREQLAKHRADASCATCHQRIDPPGFALEAFDVMGAARERYRCVGSGAEQRLEVGIRTVRFRVGPAVDGGDGKLAPAAALAALRQSLVADEAQLARNLAERLAAYATGAVATVTDRPAIDAILAAARAKRYGLRSLIHALVQSDLFLSK